MIIATTRSLLPSGEAALEFAVKSLYASLILDRTGLDPHSPQNPSAK